LTKSLKAICESIRNHSIPIINRLLSLIRITPKLWQ